MTIVAMPDLIIIDGGKDSSMLTLPLIRAVGVTNVPVISLKAQAFEGFCRRTI